MPRPRLYPDAAARQAAYRRRLRQTTVVVNRAPFNMLNHKLETLRAAVSAAAAQGDPVAKQCRAGLPDPVLDKLIAYFEARGADADADADTDTDTDTDTQV